MESFVRRRRFGGTSSSMKCVIDEHPAVPDPNIQCPSAFPCLFDVIEVPP